MFMMCSDHPDFIPHRANKPIRRQCESFLNLVNEPQVHSANHLDTIVQSWKFIVLPCETQRCLK